MDFFCKITRYYCQILKKLGLSQHILEKYSHTKFHDNPSIGTRVFPCGGQTDRPDEASSRFSQFRERTQKRQCVPLTHSTWYRTVDCRCSVISGAVTTLKCNEEQTIRICLAFHSREGDPLRLLYRSGTCSTVPFIHTVRAL